jgi:hypothetical protein
MKHTLKTAALIMIAAMALTSCQKDVKVAEEEISQEVLAQIKNLGFSTANVQKIEEGYLVEGDIVLTSDRLTERPSSPTLRIAEVEQYRTFNLVTGLPRNITISLSGNYNQNISDAVNNAIARYNAENLGITMTRVASSGNINVSVVNGGSYIASAGFPDASGNPYPQVKFNRQYRNWNNATLTTVLTHEWGHCIGFRHTDYMNRSFSCGTGGNEGQETTGVGAVHIPGTPTGPDAASWMLACIGNGVNRPFNSNDKTALNYLY